jgi:hypothetical protein
MERVDRTEHVHRSPRLGALRSGASNRRLSLTGGGPEGNEQLTADVSVVLLVALAVLGLTILRIRQLISVHLFVGLLLLGPVALKMASTGYRFTRYYTRNVSYREKGPPEPLLRVIAPVVVGTTVTVFVSGILLLFLGPRHRGPWVSIHKVSFIVWLVFTGVHVLGHVSRLPGQLRATDPDARALSSASPGGAGRLIAVAGTLVAGLVLALVLLPQSGLWTAPAAFPHHHH